MNATPLSDAIAEIWKIWSECREADWDSYQALPVSRETCCAACAFIESLPLGLSMPSIAAGSDGRLNMEWCRSPQHCFSVSVGPDGVLLYDDEPQVNSHLALTGCCPSER